MALHFAGYVLNRDNNRIEIERQWHVGENRKRAVLGFWVEMIYADGHELSFLRKTFFPHMREHELPRFWEIKDPVLVSMIAGWFREERTS